MKRKLSLTAMAALISCALCSCGVSGAHAPAASEKAADSLQIVTTIFPEYDWVKCILGDRAADAGLTLLLDNGVDLHSYQPTADDILKISTADLFVYVGGESDEWVDDALQEAVNKDMIVIDLLDVLGDRVKEEEIVEGMEAEHEDGGEEPEDDEHVWLSLKNTGLLCDAIADALKQLDPDNAAVYEANVTAYKEQLDALDAAYRETVGSASRDTLLFGDRFPLRYLVDDYNLDYYAAFAGCSAETEASFATIIFLANKVDELSLPAVLTIEGSDHSIAETVRDNTAAKDQQILTMDSMQATTSGDIANGASYLSIMEKNLEILKTALSAN